MNITFENRVALVTGAASGMGLATAKAFAESGAAVVLADWDEAAVRAATDGLAKCGHKVLAVRCDVSDDAQVEAMVDQAVVTFGRLDAAFNNAGVQNILTETADSPRDDHGQHPPIASPCPPEEIADAVVWLCSDRASYIVGQSLSVDGGFTMR